MQQRSPVHSVTVITGHMSVSFAEFLHRMTLCKLLPSTTNHNISRMSTTNKIRFTLPMCMGNGQAAVIALLVLPQDISSYLSDASLSTNHRPLLFNKGFSHTAHYKKCNKLQFVTVTGLCYASVSLCYSMRLCHSDFILMLWTYSQWLHLVDGSCIWRNHYVTCCAAMQHFKNGATHWWHVILIGSMY